MKFSQILQTVFFFLLCFDIYIALSDESSVYYLLHLASGSFVLVHSFYFFKTNYYQNFNFWIILFNMVIAGFWMILLVYIKRFDVLPENEIFSLGRFVYVFGVTFLSLFIALISMKISLSVNKKQISENENIY